MSEPDANGWMPIETAPTNKKVIAAYRNQLGNWRTVMATLYSAGALENHDEDSDEEFAPAGWYEECESRETIYPVDGDPSYWQHPPKPPVSPNPSPSTGDGQ